MMRYAFWSSLLIVACGNTAAPAAEARFAQTGSRSQYAHWIEMFDANNRRIDPADPQAPPYSPQRTCGRCHDYNAIAQGHHFNALAKVVPPGRPGEPWLWTDTRTGTQIPLSYRGWSGTYDPEVLGISAWDFVLKFGRHLPGGGPGQPGKAPAADAAPATPAPPAAGATESSATATPAESASASETALRGRWKLSGNLEVDCMLCHVQAGGYSMESWWEQIEAQNFAWAPTAALGIGFVQGKVSSLPDDFDPAAADENSRHKLPVTTYASLRVNPEKKVFFDVIRRPGDNVCYYCHTTRQVGPDLPPDWNCDQDVHLQAGLTCSDCHRNGIDHHTVRGYEGESHPTGQSVASLSCRGCHMEGEHAGRLGAPLPLHKGLPPLHFDKLSCTACHSGPRPAAQAAQLMTALAHGLGLPQHDWPDDMPPGIAAPAFLREEGRLYPHRLTWPAFWGSMQGEQIVPLNPEEVYNALRTTLRIRRGQTLNDALRDVSLTKDEKKEILGDRAEVAAAELTEQEQAQLAERTQRKVIEEFRTKLAKALTELKKIIRAEGAQPVYVEGGRVWREGAEGQPEEFEHQAARPYAWKLGHDVRPARESLGVHGCYDCHQMGQPIFEGTVTASSPVPVETPQSYAMYELAGFDKFQLDAWNQSFQGRTAFKWLGFLSMGVVSVVLFGYALRGFTGLARRICR